MARSRANVDLRRQLDGYASDQIKRWLKSAFGPLARKIFLFGSAAGGYAGDDVDVILQLEQTDRVAACVKECKRLAKQFESLFQKPLHPQFFLSGEDAKLGEFLVKAHPSELIQDDLIGEEPSSH